jgi:hypothetical protein
MFLYNGHSGDTLVWVLVAFFVIIAYFTVGAGPATDTDNYDEEE